MVGTAGLIFIFCNAFRPKPHTNILLNVLLPVFLPQVQVERNHAGRPDRNSHFAPSGSDPAAHFYICECEYAGFLHSVPDYGV